MKVEKQSEGARSIASAILAVSLLAAAIVVGVQFKAYQKATTATEPDSPVVDVHVFSINVGDQPWVVFSNYKTEPAEDGTVRVSTTSKNEFE